MNKILVTRKLPDKVIDKLNAHAELDIWPDNEAIPRDELLKRVAGKDGVLCMLTDKIDAELLDVAGPQLKVVSTMSVGFDHIDVAECAKRKVAIGFTPGVLSDTVADMAVTLMLMASRRAVEAVDAAKDGQWGSWQPYWMCGMDLHHSTVGIVGLGGIGTIMAKRLNGFGCKMVYYNRSRREDLEKEIGIEYRSFNELIKESDFVSLHVPLTPETKDMINTEVLHKMKPSSVLINTSRGGTVNQQDLYEALKSGQIFGAGLDVTDPEPLPTNSPLYDLPNCVITPHIASASTATRNAMAELAVENLIAGLDGKELKAEVKI